MEHQTECVRSCRLERRKSTIAHSYAPTTPGTPVHRGDREDDDLLQSYYSIIVAVNPGLYQVTENIGGAGRNRTGA
jgi:hypothetical protein